MKEIDRGGCHPEARQGIEEVIRLCAGGWDEVGPPDTDAFQKGAPGLPANAASLRQLDGPSPVQIEEDDLRVSLDHDRTGWPITTSAQCIVDLADLTGDRPRLKREAEIRRHRCRPGICEEDDLTNRCREDRSAAERPEKPASGTIGLTTADGEHVEEADRYVDRDPFERHIEDRIEGRHDSEFRARRGSIGVHLGERHEPSSSATVHAGNESIGCDVFPGHACSRYFRRPLPATALRPADLDLSGIVPEQKAEQRQPVA